MSWRSSYHGIKQRSRTLNEVLKVGVAATEQHYVGTTYVHGMQSLREQPRIGCGDAPSTTDVHLADDEVERLNNLLIAAHDVRRLKICELKAYKSDFSSEKNKLQTSTPLVVLEYKKDNGKNQNVIFIRNNSDKKIVWPYFGKEEKPKEGTSFFKTVEIIKNNIQDM